MNLDLVVNSSAACDGIFGMVDVGNPSILVLRNARK